MPQSSRHPWREHRFSSWPILQCTRYRWEEVRGSVCAKAKGGRDAGGVSGRRSCLGTQVLETIQRAASGPEQNDPRILHLTDRCLDLHAQNLENHPIKWSVPLHVTGRLGRRPRQEYRRRRSTTSAPPPVPIPAVKQAPPARTLLQFLLNLAMHKAPIVA